MGSQNEVSSIAFIWKFSDNKLQVYITISKWNTSCVYVQLTKSTKFKHTWALPKRNTTVEMTSKHWQI